MKFVIAPDKYKGSLTGSEFCNAVEEGLRMVFENAEIVKSPLADGGDGTLEVVKNYTKGTAIECTVHDPLMRLINSTYLYASENHLAFIEMAEASGLRLLREDEKNCMSTTSLGTGELIVDAIDKGVKEIILGIGGSATNDGGMGIAHALGFRFLDENNKELTPIGQNLIAVKKMDNSGVHPELKSVNVKVACDVENPFFGENGAAKIYAKQKGASVEEIEMLDKGLQNVADVVLKDFNVNLQQIRGAGAAGGVGGGAIVFLNANLTSGINLIKELTDFEHQIKGADWIITGEGQLDAQTLAGKTIGGVVESAKRQNIKVAALCGSLDISIENQKELGLAYAVSIVKGVSNLDQAMTVSYSNLVDAAYNFGSLLKNA